MGLTCGPHVTVKVRESREDDRWACVERISRIFIKNNFDSWLWKNNQDHQKIPRKFLEIY
jgi:hypothetical protein